MDWTSMHVGQRKQIGFPRFVVGFAAESENLAENSRAKLKAKDLDMIVANDITASEAGFAVETNQVALFFRDGGEKRLPLMSKSEVADAVLDHVLGQREKVKDRRTQDF